MRRADGIPEPGRVAAPTAVTVGVFDGVHVGHTALAERTVAAARALGGEAVALTFRTHPDLLLRGRAPLPLATLEDRLEALARAGIDVAVVVDFTPAVRDTSPEVFAREVFERRLGGRRLLLGFDSAICSRREGTVERFRELGVDAERIERVTVAGTVVSSSAIRSALEAGDVALAARLLGRPWSFAGEVVRGEARGRELGFPTANLVPPPLTLPMRGVYAVRAALDGEELPGVANLGTRPTVTPDGPPLVEVHLLGFSGDLYGRTLRISFVDRLRAEQRFASLDELCARIGADVEAASALLATAPRALDRGIGAT